MAMNSVMSGTPLSGRAPTGARIATPQRMGASLIAAPSTSQVYQSWSPVCAPNGATLYGGSHAATPTTSLPPSVILRPINKQYSSSSLSGTQKFDSRQQVSGSNSVPPMPQFQGVPTPLGGSLANVAPAEPQQTQSPRQCAVDETLQAELESLRRTASSQHERIVQLTNQLDASRVSEEKFRHEAHAAQAEAARLAEELRLERLARQQAAAAALECPVAPATACDYPMAVSATSAPIAGEPLQTAKIDVAPVHISEPRSRPPSTRSNTGGAPRNASSSARRRMQSPQAAPSPSPPGTGRGHKSKDEVDARLQEWLDRNKCDLEFRRLNQAWYAFRHIEDRLPLTNDQTVELRIVNNKLMAKLEPTTHDAGWNNGKLGPIERFVAAFSG